MECFFHLFHEFFSCFSRSPFCFWLERNHDVRSFDRHWVSWNLGTSNTANDLFHFRIFSLQLFLSLGTTFYHLRERSSLRHTHFYGKIPFFQTWNKFSSKKLECHKTDTEQSNGTCYHVLVLFQYPVEDRKIPLLYFLDHLVGESLFLADFLAKEEATCHRNIRK